MKLSASPRTLERLRITRPLDPLTFASSKLIKVIVILKDLEKQCCGYAFRL